MSSLARVLRPTLQRTTSPSSSPARAEVKRLAHHLRGSLTTFAAQAAFDAALELEAMGRTGDLTGAEAAFVSLRDALRHLQKALARRTNR